MKIQATETSIEVFVKHEGVTYLRSEEIETDQSHKQSYYAITWYKLNKGQDFTNWLKVSTTKHLSLELLYDNIQIN